VTSFFLFFCFVSEMAAATTPVIVILALAAAVGAAVNYGG
jgi:hypothetical protein